MDPNVTSDENFASYFEAITNREFTILDDRIYAFLVLFEIIGWSLIAYLAYHFRREILFHCVRSFLRVILNIFFRQIDLVGLENVPRYGPCIFVANHQNQFVDGILLMSSTPRYISFLIAQKSFHRPIVGFLSSIARSIPVLRPQDVAKSFKVPLTFRRDDVSIQAEGLGAYAGPGFVIQFANPFLPTEEERKAAEPLIGRVASVVNDNEVCLEKPFLFPPKDARPSDEMTVKGFKVVPKIDHNVMYQKVFDVLHQNHCLGIFPEGGSHDRPELLPLKPGVGIMALGAMEQNPYMARVAIVPCGLHYMTGHKFRSRVCVEYGQPVYVPWNLVEKYKSDKRQAVATLMQDVEKSLRGVTINVEDRTLLNTLYVARRLYTPENMSLTAEQRVRLNERFAQAFALLKDEPEIAALQADIAAYGKLLRKHEMRTGREKYSRRMLIWKICYVLFFASLALIPGLLLNAPVGLACKFLSMREARKAVQSSSVKIDGKDVIASYKILTAMVLLPSWYATCSLLLVLFSGLHWTGIVLCIIAMPLFSYLGIWFAQQGVIMSRSIKSLILRFMPSWREEQDSIPQQGKELSKRLRAAVDHFAPSLGEGFRRIISSEDFQKYGTD